MRTDTEPRRSASSDGDRRARVRGLGWAALAGILVVQVWGLYVAQGTGSAWFPHSDKVAHLALFAVPAALAVLLGARTVLALVLLHAVAAEPLQGWLTTTRVTDVWDGAANLTGVALGVLAAVWLGRRT